MSVVAVPALQLNPRRSQTRSLGILSSDSSLTLWRSKLCGGASFVAAPLRESSTFSYFYLHMVVKSDALPTQDKKVPIFDREFAPEQLI